MIENKRIFSDVDCTSVRSSEIDFSFKFGSHFVEIPGHLQQPFSHNLRRDCRRLLTSQLCIEAIRPNKPLIIHCAVPPRKNRGLRYSRKPTAQPLPNHGLKRRPSPDPMAHVSDVDMHEVIVGIRVIADTTETHREGSFVQFSQ